MIGSSHTILQLSPPIGVCKSTFVMQLKWSVTSFLWLPLMENGNLLTLAHGLAGHWHKCIHTTLYSSIKPNPVINFNFSERCGETAAVLANQVPAGGGAQTRWDFSNMKLHQVSQKNVRLLYGNPSHKQTFFLWKHVVYG